jgi:Zn-finger protein
VYHWVPSDRYKKKQKIVFGLKIVFWSTVATIHSCSNCAWIKNLRILKEILGILRNKKARPTGILSQESRNINKKKNISAQQNA